MTRAEFTEAVGTYCGLMQGSVTSWWRSVQHNTARHGVPGSPHLFGVGADVIYDAPWTIERRKLIAQRLGLALIAEEDHDHLQPAAWPAG